jgi:uncharacterized protein (DUF1800 family)
MATTSDPRVEHLLRRAGFGARPDELLAYRTVTVEGLAWRMIDYEDEPDDVDSKINAPGYVQFGNRAGSFTPNTLIADARLRWLFRMVHTNRPLQEKMTLFWHNHFATAYGKLNGMLGAVDATRYMAAKPTEDVAGVRGQIEMLRDNALGNFRDMLVHIAQDVAMLYWLDGRLNTRTRPQENFGREVMELFTLGVGNYTEQDVYTAARVFTGWNLTNRGTRLDFLYNPNQHDTAAKTFTFPIYADGGKTIPARAAAQGMQDGLDFIDGLCAHPATGRYLARKLWRFFVSEVNEPSERWIRTIANTFVNSRYEMRPVIRAVLTSGEFWDSANTFTRYSWPVEFVVRALKDIGWRGFSATDALTPLGNMGQNLYDPPDVAGWELGSSWFSTGSMLARMNFASALAGNQKFNLATAAKPTASTPDGLLAFVLDALRTPGLDRATVGYLGDYLRATGAWTGSDTQIQNKVAGLVHLVAGTPEYQFI